MATRRQLRRPVVANGLTIRQLAERSGIGVRRIRYWLTRDLLPKPPFRGSRTLYPEQVVVRLKAIQRLRGDAVSIPEVRRRLAAISDVEIRTLAGVATV